MTLNEIILYRMKNFDCAQKLVVSRWVYIAYGKQNGKLTNTRTIHYTKFK